MKPKFETHFTAESNNKCAAKLNLITLGLRETENIEQIIQILIIILLVSYNRVEHMKSDHIKWLITLTISHLSVPTFYSIK